MTPSDPEAANGGERRADEPNGCRRDFLKTVGALPAALAASQVAGTATAGTAEQPGLPETRIGRHAISRLICGANPFGGGSHLSVFVNHEMRRYHTPEQIIRTLRRCQEVGINCWQSGGDNVRLYRRFLDEGGSLHYLSIESGDPARIPALAAAGCIGIAHHGEATDQLFKTGRFDQIRDYLARIRDAGLLVGVSTHMPAVVEAVESRGWDLDYYMTCVYERHRSAADLERLLGHVPIPVGEVYLTSDPPRMFRAMRQTRRPCLAFKILAAGRLSDRPEWVERAFRETFAAIKPTDAVIIGLYDRYSDQPAEDAALVRRFAPLSRHERAG